MLFGLWVPVLLRHSKVNNVNNVGCFSVWSTNQEIIGLDVPVDEVLFVDRLNSRQLNRMLERYTVGRPAVYHLLGDHHYRLDRELPVAVIEQILEARS